MIKIIRIVVQVIILYAFQYLGVLIVFLTKIPLPPSVVGFILLFICLLLNWLKVEYIRDGATFLISFMLLFYIPPMVGIIDYPQLLSPSGTILICVVILSTIFSVLVTIFISQRIESKEEELKKLKDEKREITVQVNQPEYTEGQESQVEDIYNDAEEGVEKIGTSNIHH